MNKVNPLTKKMWRQNPLQLVICPKRLKNKLLSTLSRCAFCHPKLRVRLISALGVNFASIDEVFIGNNVYFDELNPNLIQVGRNVYFTEGVRVLTHFYDKSKPPHYHKIGPVIIEDDVFIGFNVVIAESVTIGKGAVIGANSVVTKNVLSHTIVAGSPCQPIGTRCLMKVSDKN